MSRLADKARAGPAASDKATLAPPRGSRGAARVAERLQGGSSLPATTRERMEAAFGRSFEDVRIHRDAVADRVTREHGAEALAIGNRIAFGAARFRPGSAVGDHLIAHELAHIAQQGGGDAVATRAAGSQPGEPAELAAEAAAKDVMRGEPVRIQGLTLRGRILRRALRPAATPVPGSARGGSTEAPGRPERRQPPDLDEDERTAADERQPTAQERTPLRPAITASEPVTAPVTAGQESASATPLAATIDTQGSAEVPALPPGLVDEQAEADGDHVGGDEVREEITPEPPAATAAGEGVGRRAAAQRAAAAFGALQAEIGRLAELAARPMRFAANADERSSEALRFFRGVAQRHRAEAVASRFLAHRAATVRGILDQATAAAPPIRAAAFRHRMQAAAAGNASRAAIADQVEATRRQARGRAAAASKTVNVHRRSSHNEVAAATRAASSEAAAGKDAAVEAVTPLASRQRERIDQLYRDGDSGYRDSGRRVGAEAREIAARRARQWLGERNGESTVLDGPVHDRRLEARAETAQEVGTAFQRGLVDTANQQADQGQQGKPRDLAAVAAASDRARRTLEQQQQTAEEGFTAGERSTHSTADRTYGSLRGSLSETLGQTVDTLSAQLISQDSSLASYLGTQGAALDRDADHAAAAIFQGAARAAGELADPLRSFVREAIGVEAPRTAALTLLRDEMQGMMDGVVDNVTTRLHASAAAAQRGTAAGGAALADSLAALGRSGARQAAQAGTAYQTGLEAVLDHATELLANVAAAHAATCQTGVDTALQGFADVHTGIEELFGTLGENLGLGFEQAARGLEEALRRELEREPGVIQEETDRAAVQVEPRWKTVAKVLLTIVVIVAVAIVLGPAVIGFVGAAAGALGAGATAAGAIGTIIGGAIVGAAAGATIQLGNNLIDGRPLMENVLEQAAIGAISGIFGGAGGALSSRIVGTAARQVIQRVAIDVAFDITGGIVADLAVKGDFDLVDALKGAASGLGVSGAMSNIGRFGRPGQFLQRIQGRAFAFGEAAGAAAGGAARSAFSQPPATPRAETVDAPPAPKTEEPKTLPAPRAEEPEAKTPRTAEPETPPARAEEEPQATSSPAEGTSLRADSPEIPPDIQAFLGKRVEEGSPPGYRQPYQSKNGKWVIARAPGRSDLPRLTADENGNIHSKAEESTTPAKPEETAAPAAPSKTNAQEATLTKATEKPVAKADMTPAERVAKQEQSVATLKQELAEVQARRIKLIKVQRKADLERSQFADASFKADDRTTKQDLKQQAGAARDRVAALKEQLDDLPSDDTLLKREIARAERDLETARIHLDPEKHRAGLPCFAGDTPVSTVAGPKRIDDLRPGDWIFSFDFARHRVVECVITQIHNNKTLHFFDVRAGGTVIQATGQHRFWEESRSTWIAARDLEAGMSLRSLDGKRVPVESVSVRENLESDTYNLSVDDSSNYFVGTGVLVHNAGIDLGLGGNKVVYRLVNTKDPRFAGKAYIGQTVLLDSEGRPFGAIGRADEHRAYARKMLDDPPLSPENREFFEFMKNVDDPTEIVRGINKDQANYLEQKNMDLERELHGDDSLMNRRKQLNSTKEEVAKRIANDPAVQKAGYCPR